jgi:hypothetical protein
MANSMTTTPCLPIPSKLHCFDPVLATSRTLILPIDQIVDLLQVTHTPGRVAEYYEAMRRGDRFPPICVLRVGRRFLIADGHKRFSACRSLPGTDIVAQVWGVRRWLQDQWRQSVNNFRKNQTIVRLSIHSPRKAFRLLLTTLGHWRRVATSLLQCIKRSAAESASKSCAFDKICRQKADHVHVHVHEHVNVHDYDQSNRKRLCIFR